MNKFLLYLTLIFITFITPANKVMAYCDIPEQNKTSISSALVGTTLSLIGLSTSITGYAVYKHCKSKIKKLKTSLPVLKKLSEDLVNIDNKDLLTEEDLLKKQSIEKQIATLLNEEIIPSFNIKKLREILNHKQKIYKHLKLISAVFGISSMLVTLFIACMFGIGTGICCYCERNNRLDGYEQFTDDSNPKKGDL
jgi:hypothetical protein